jgi:tetratricopeptide repeat protein
MPAAGDLRIRTKASVLSTSVGYIVSLRYLHLKDFYKKQWAVPAPTSRVGQHVEFPEHQILPFERLGSLRQGDSYGEVSKTVIHDNSILVYDNILESAYQLGYVLGMQEKYEEAETLHRQTFVFEERVLGKDHPNTLWSAYELGYKLSLSRQYNEKGMSSLSMKIFRLFSSLLRFASLSKMLTLLHLSSRVAAEGFKHALEERDEDHQVLGRYFDVREYLQVCPPP